jgi:hypothetical protein
MVHIHLVLVGDPAMLYGVQTHEPFSTLRRGRGRAQQQRGVWRDEGVVAAVVVAVALAVVLLGPSALSWRAARGSVFRCRQV